MESTAPLGSLSVWQTSLAAAVATVPDPRRAGSVISPVPAILTLAATDLTAYLDWPGLAHVFRLERTWRERGATKRAVHDGMTSLSPEDGPADRLLALRRGH